MLEMHEYNCVYVFEDLFLRQIDNCFQSWEDCLIANMILVLCFIFFLGKYVS